MEKFLITAKSGNRITGPIMVTTSPRATCPTACPYKKDSDGPEAGLCYAEHGHLGHYIWTGLDRVAAGRSVSGRIPVYDKKELLRAVRAQPEGTIWRHNQAGDLPSRDTVTINEEALRPLVAANRGRRGFTYTHFDVIENADNRRIVRDANRDGFTINLSGDTLEEADVLAGCACGPVTVVVAADQLTNTKTPAGRTVVICPARTRTLVSCATCGLCAVPHRATIIGFPALGPKRHAKASR